MWLDPLQLADVIQARLDERRPPRVGAREECLRLESATDERDPETVWERLPRIGQLDPRTRAVARELAVARAHGLRPGSPGRRSCSTPRWSNWPTPPLDVAALEQIRGIHPPDQAPRRRRFSTRSPWASSGPIPGTRPRRSEPGDAPLIVLAEALLRGRALEAGLAYELIASRASSS